MPNGPGVDHQAGDSLAMIRRVAESDFRRLGAAVEQMRVVFPCKSHTAVDLNRAVAHFAIGITGIGFGD